ncbi:MAG: hypothetical protein ABWX65_05415 [Mycetocola sp.]
MSTPPNAGSYRTEVKASGGLVVGTLAWVATLALARFGPGLWGEGLWVLSWAAVVVNVVVGVLWIVAFARFLRAVDELQRKIMQDALTAALGAGWVVGFGYVAADAAGLVATEVDVAALPVLMGIVFLGAVVVGRVRYR